ncbi:MAG: hypothetical protein JRF40_14630 [Deltaproteobacteria bacterium]|nr:hypothetical protein [Deltaproteobacteria bacterium]
MDVNRKTGLLRQWVEKKNNEVNCTVVIDRKVQCKGKAGEGIEAFTAVSAGSLTEYDMCKAVDKDT